MKRFKNKAAASIASVLLFAMVCGVSVPTFAAEPSTYSEINEFSHAYGGVAMYSTNKKLSDYTPYNGNEEAYGTERFSGNGYHTGKFTEAVDRCMKAYTMIKYGVECEKIEDSTGFEIAPVVEGVTLDKTMYGRAYKATINGVDRFFTYHFDDAKGNISFWERTKTEGPNVYWKEKKVDSVCSVSFYQENGTTSIYSVCVPEGTNLTNYYLTTVRKKVKGAKHVENTEASVPGAAGESYWATFDNVWVPVKENASYTMDDLADVRSDMSFKVSYTREDISVPKFSISKTTEFAEDGSANPKEKDFFHLASDFTVDAKLTKYENIKSLTLGNKETEEEIISRFVGNVPTLEDFLNHGKESKGVKTTSFYKENPEEFLENYYIRWYVVKFVNTCWHIDGVIERKPVEVEETTPDTTITIPQLPSRAVIPEENVATSEINEEPSLIEEVTPAAVEEDEEAVLPAQFVNEENVPAEAEVSAKEETAVLGFAVATGDNTPLFVMIVILLVSLGAVAFLGCKRGIEN
ncbi:MAG: hypothetical protein E7241_09160 [Lachnospiraceae bacterium]|nr:hypothetical protein [Lachnospiraceae bacterium]